jgi:hypothetical protein
MATKELSRPIVESERNRKDFEDAIIAAVRAGLNPTDLIAAIRAGLPIPIVESERGPTTILDALLTKVVLLTLLPNNWDGYGAIPPNELINKQINDFLPQFPERLLQYTTTDDMYATPHGTVVLEFQKEKNELIIEFGEREYGFFTDLKHGKNVKIKRTMYKQNSPIANELAEAINSFYRS